MQNPKPSASLDLLNAHNGCIAECVCCATSQVLIAPRNHPVLQAGPLQREQLYSLQFVCLNEGSTVQAAQAAMLRRHGIAWRRLQIDMVCSLLCCCVLLWLPCYNPQRPAVSGML